MISPKKTIGFNIENMDPSADPRQDFYRFAAGGWLDQAVIADTDAQVSDYMELVHRVNEQIVTLLEHAAENSKNEPQGSPAQQVGDFFAAAMDTERLEKLGFSPLQPDLELINAINTLSDLAGAIAYFLANTGQPMLVITAVSPDTKQNDVNILQVYPSGLTLPTRDYYLTEAFASARAAYLEHISEMLQQAGIGADEAAAQARTVLALETTMAEAMLSPVEAANPAARYHLMSVATLKELTPRFDFDTFFKELGLTTDGQINVAEPGYMEALNTLLEEHSLDDFKTYLRWRLITGVAEYLSPSAAERSLNFFQKKLHGTTELLPRERRVATQIQRGLGHPTAQLYVREYFTAETRQRVEAMVAQIKDQFKQRLESNPWLDEPTRAFALDKLKQLEINVGYPENWIDYSSVTVQRDDYLGNMKRLNQFDIKRNLDRLGQPVEDDEFAYPGHTLPTDINAAYQPGKNKIEITAAILQPPFYYPDMDAAVNYGAIGAVIGHEMTHGFDSIGRRFDAKGNMQDWWTPGDSEEFEALTDVLVEQFNQFEVLPGLFVNGRLTVTENTADLGGVTLSFEAMQKAMDGQPAPEKVDGYSAEERFFLAWAQLWMTKTRPEAARQLISFDPHAPSAFRATGPFVNLDAFYETFNIQPGDAMWRDEADRVEIW